MPPLHNRPHGRRFTSRVGPGMLLLRAGRDESLRCGPVPELPLAVESPTVRHRARTRRNCAGVAETCGWDAQAEATRDGLWRQAVQSRVIADLAVAVEAPAVADSGGRDPAGVVRTAAHECELEPPLHRGRYRLAYRRVIAQLTGTVGTPAIRGSGWCHGARMVVPCVQCGEGDTSRGISLDRRGLGDAGIITQLARTIISPAVHGPARRETAAVKETRRDGGEGHPRGCLHERGAKLVGAAIVAELAVGVPSPAISHTSGGREAAAVRRPGAHGGERHAGRRCDQDRSPSVGTRAVAESSELVSTPTIGIAGGRDCAGMLPAGTDSLERHAHRGLYARRDMLTGAAILANLAATCTAGLITAPVLALFGCTVKTSRVAAPAAMANAPLVAPAKPGADAVRV